MMNAERQIIKTVTDRLVQGLHPDQIILFGSYAYGTPDTDSDLDLLIVVPDSREPQYKRARECYRILRGIGIPKDIIVLTRQEYDRQLQSASTVAGLATQKGKVLYERPAT